MEAPPLEGWDVRQVVRAFVRRLPLIVICAVVAGAGAFAFSSSQRKEYSATASLLFQNNQLDQTLFGATILPPSTDPAREAATNAELTSLQVVAQRTASVLGRGLTAQAVQSKISTSPVGLSDLVSITATDPSPNFAALLANTYADQFIAFRRSADQSQVAGAQQLVRQQLARMSPAQRNRPQARSLQNRAQQLGILAAMQTGNVELSQPALAPSAPSSPKIPRNTILGVVLGLGLGVLLAFVLELLDRRIKDFDDLEAAYDLPILAAVPESEALAANDGVGAELPLSEAESFRMLRARLRYFNVDRPIRSVMVTSAAPGEGKTTVARNLAAAAATSTGSRVLLLEADLRQPTLARRYRLKPAPGLAELLSHDSRLDDAVQRLSLGTSENGARASVSLDVVVAGGGPPNPAELLESETMAEFLQRLSTIYDLVVIDTPPTTAVSDAIPLINRVSGVIVVSQMGTSSKVGALHLRRELARLGANSLGVVANRLKKRRAGGYYGYGGYAVAYGGESPQPETVEGEVS